ncbi:GNAT family [Colletotrichum kahawae]|uniref:GNAT family n=1 Tax=Colletotrichum kahawae TaxID=34407 RepID=A0AAD9XYM9_COLKA|nr:GNAT family [Colletotrichum kahawae]
MSPKFIVLPKSHPSLAKFLQLSDRYKAFRLLSLRLSPESFGSTYAREVAFAPEKWLARLSNPLATTIVAVDDGGITPPSPVQAPSSDDADRILSIETADAAESDFELALDAEWLASLTISGPLDMKTLATHLHLEESFVDFGPAHKLDLGPAARKRDSDSDRPRRQFVVNGMYVLPIARGHSLGVQILECAKRYVAAEAKVSGERVRLLLIVDYDNPPARRTYEKCGFEVVHRYWFDDYREGREARTEAAVMVVDLNEGDGSGKKAG